MAVQRTITEPTVGACTYSTSIQTKNGATVSVSGIQVFDVLAGVSRLYTLANAIECKCGSHDVTLTQRTLNEMSQEGMDIPVTAYAMLCNTCGAALQLNIDPCDEDALVANRTGEYVGWFGGKQSTDARQSSGQNQQPRNEQRQQTQGRQSQPRQTNNQDGRRYQQNQQRQPSNYQGRQSNTQYDRQQSQRQPSTYQQSEHYDFDPTNDEPF